jgi:hypothetical protein
MKEYSVYLSIDLICRIVRSRPSSLSDLSIKFKPRKCKIVRAGAVLSHLHDSEEAVAVIPNFTVGIEVDPPSCGATLLLQVLLVVLIVSLAGIVHVDSAIENDPVDLVIRSFEVPVHDYMSCRVSVS